MVLAKSKFKPQLIGIDEYEIQAAKKKAEDTCCKVNSLFEEVEKATGYELTFEEKWKIISHKKMGVLEIIRQRINMPVQKPETVFEFAGLNQANIATIFNRYRTFETYLVKKFEYKNNVFKVPSIFYDEIEKEHTHYTKNKKQSEAFETLKILADSLEKSIENRWLSVHHTNFKGIRMSLIEKWINAPLRVTNGKLVPNWQSIKAIQE